MKSPVRKLMTVATIATALTATSTLVGCAEQADTTTVSGSFKMTSSPSAATVSWTEKYNPINWLLPMAKAFMPSVIVDSSGATVTLDNAWVVVKEVEFKSQEVAGVEDSEIEISFQGPYVVDLLSNAPATLDAGSIPAMEIRRIKMKLHAAEEGILPAGSPAQLTDNSIYLSGTVGANAFSYESTDTTEFEIGGPNPILPNDGAEMLVAINLANVFKQIDLSGLPNGAAVSESSRYAGSNLCPLIDPSANDVYTCIRNGIRAHAEFGEDSDGDDDLDTEDESVD